MPAVVFATDATASDASETADDGGVIHEFGREVVIATLVARAVGDAAKTVDVTDRKIKDERLIRDLKDLFRYEPGIAVTSGFGRCSLGDIRYRDFIESLRFVGMNEAGLQEFQSQNVADARIHGAEPKTFVPAAAADW